MLGYNARARGIYNVVFTPSTCDTYGKIVIHADEMAANRLARLCHVVFNYYATVMHELRIREQECMLGLFAESESEYVIASHMPTNGNMPALQNSTPHIAVCTLEARMKKGSITAVLIYPNSMADMLVALNGNHETTFEHELLRKIDMHYSSLKPYEFEWDIARQNDGMNWLFSQQTSANANGSLDALIKNALQHYDPHRFDKRTHWRTGKRGGAVSRKRREEETRRRVLKDLDEIVF